ncbi:MAG: hypothetical protein E7633_10200 [Ruminococcaceae bacterium]|nr:hypothetical protein [Oscillospiraceae bacterium]
MFSLTYFILHTALIILSFIYPEYIDTFSYISFMLAYYLYFRRFYKIIRISTLFGLGIIAAIPTIVLGIIYVVTANKPDLLLKIVLFTYAIVIIFNYVVPIVKYLKLRITLYLHIQKLVAEKNYRTSATFKEFLLKGANAPYNILIETPDATVTLAILGTVGASRYIFENNFITAQRYSDDRLNDIEYHLEIENFEENMDDVYSPFSGIPIFYHLASPIIGPILGVKHRRYLPRLPVSDKTLLILQPNSFIKIDKRILGIGEKIGPYTVIRPKTAITIL